MAQAWPGRVQCLLATVIGSGVIANPDRASWSRVSNVRFCLAFWESLGVAKPVEC